MQMIGMLLAGLFIAFKVYFFNLLYVVSGLFASAYAGRVYCGWFCPNGAWLEHGVSRFSRRKGLPDTLKKPWVRYSITAVFLAVLIALFLSDVKRWIIPLAVMGSMVLAGTVLGALFYPRAFCAYLCPWGVMQTLIGRRAKLQVVIDSNCRSCFACVKACPIDKAPEQAVLNVKQTRDASALSSRCIRCMKCVSICPSNAIHLATVVQKSANAGGSVQVGA